MLAAATLRERFGWWPVARARLDYRLAGAFRVQRPARVRVVLVDKDGWTPLATSRVVTSASPLDARARAGLTLHGVNADRGSASPGRP